MVTSIKGNDTSTFGGAIDTTKVITDAPGFSAEVSANFTVSNSVWTKMPANTEDWDFTNDYDNVTNYRFTPSVEGYYLVTAHTRAFATTTLNQHNCSLYKNGSNFKQFFLNKDLATAEGNGSVTVYMNGTTDYLEVYVNVNGSGTLRIDFNAAGGNWWQAHLVRAV